MSKSIDLLNQKEANLTYAEVAANFLYDGTTGQFTRTTGPRKNSTFAPNKAGYIVLRINGVGHRAHRVAWLLTHKRWPEGQIDHIDGNRSNNAINNLREATRQLNIANSKIYRSNKTGFRGVFQSRRTFQANIYVDGKRIYLGTYSTAAEAGAVYDAEAKRRFGDFVRRS